MFDFVVTILVLFVIGFVLKRLDDRFGAPIQTWFGEKIAALAKKAGD